MHRFYSYLCNQKLLTIISCFYLALMPVCVYASAAEDIWKWERPVKQSPQSIGIKAYKVDAVGTAVNDVKYATSVNVESAAARQAMGKTMMNRVLGATGWGLLGVAALDQLLDGIGWVIDPAAQSIWRNKVSTPPNDTNTCRYTKGSDLVFFYSSNWAVEKGSCPDAIAERVALNSRAPEASEIRDIKFIPSVKDQIDAGNTSINFKFTWINRNNGAATANDEGYLNTITEPTTQEREEMTPETMADIMTGKHPDVPPDVWTAVEEAFVPETPIEQQGPAAEVVKDALEKGATETSKDTEVKPDPVTGGSKLPNFCSWASSVCNFFKQFNDTPTQKDDTEIDIELPEPAPDVSISFGGTCPDAHHIPIKFWLVDTEMTLSYEWPCKLASIIYYPIIACASYTAALIVAGIRSTED